MNDNDLIRRGDVRKYAAPLDTEDGEVMVIDLDDINEIPAVPQEMTAREEEYDNFEDIPWPIKFFALVLACSDRADSFDAIAGMSTEEAVAAIKQWAKDHPKPRRKTCAEDFLEKFPKTNVKYLGKGNGDRLLGYCRDAIYKGEIDKKHCARCYCSACWNEEMEVQDGNS